MRCILLAAGQSSRFQGIKQLSPWGLPDILPKIKDLQLPCSLILGAHFHPIFSSLSQIPNTPPHLEIHRNQDFAQGMSSSLQLAQKLYPKTDLFFILCDQPHIPLSHYQYLYDLYKNDPTKIYASGIKNQVIGPPTILPYPYTLDIPQLRGDVGAKSILKKYSSQVILVEYEEYTRKNYNYPISSE